MSYANKSRTIKRQAAASSPFTDISETQVKTARKYGRAGVNILNILLDLTCLTFSQKHSRGWGKWGKHIYYYKPFQESTARTASLVKRKVCNPDTDINGDQKHDFHFWPEKLDVKVLFFLKLIYKFNAIKVNNHILVSKLIPFLSKRK